jgi:hypothetical protein
MDNIDHFNCTAHADYVDYADHTDSDDAGTMLYMVKGRPDNAR